ncbi:transcription factor E4F1 isoform X2 [Pleurodeles waltl]|uniref:transcription factor E4F1 isoform X2 n=1 Tax=Pleurodeles waltl TaxID=8319 RepID=UPI0037098B41
MSGAESGLTAAVGTDAYLSLRAARSAEDEDDVHKCGRCQVEFTSLDDFVQHKVQKSCQRAQEDTSQDTTAVHQEEVPSVEESITVAHILLEASSLSEVIRNVAEFGCRTTDEGISSQEHVFEVQVEDSNDGEDGAEDEADIKTKKLVLNEDGRYVCEVCRKTFKTSSILKAHLITHSSKKNFECTSCGEAFRTKGSLIRHNRRHTGDSINGSPVIRLLTDAKGNVLHEVHVQMQEFAVCPKSTSDEVSNSEEILPDGSINSGNLLRHAMQNSGIVIETVKLEDLHKYEEVSSSEETKDINDVEENPDGTQCTQMEEHEATDGTTENVFQNHSCPHCNEIFPDIDELKVHIQGHQGFQSHKCAHCGKEFVKWHLLKKHLEVHFTERRYKCGECGKLYKTIAHVKGHLRVHSDDRPFPCSRCGKRYKTKSAQQVHFRTHMDDKPFACQFCSRSFREKGSLVRHTRHHTGEKPYKCFKCGRGFAEHGTLNRHLRTKSGCLLALKDAEEVLVSEENQSSDSMAETLVSDDPNTVLVEFSSVVADTQEYIIETSADEAIAGAAEITDRTRHKVDNQLMKVVQHIVNHANSGHQIIVQNLALGTDAGSIDVSDTITIATPESLTEQVALTLASAIEEGTVLTEAAMEAEEGTLTLVASQDIEMLEQSGEFVLASQEGEVEVQTVIV